MFFLQPGNNGGDRVDRIWRSASVLSRVQVVRRSAYLHLGVEQAAQPGDQARQPFGVELPIGHPRHITGDLAGVPLDPAADSGATDLFLALNQYLDIQRQPAALITQE